MLEDHENGVKPMFRNRNWKYDEREEKKINNKVNCYKNGKQLNIVLQPLQIKDSHYEIYRNQLYS